MRRSSLVVLIIAGIASACGGSSDPTSSPNDPPKKDPPSNFPSATGTWSGTLTYRSCEESEGFGVCATLRPLTTTSFRATIAQTPQTHSEGGLIVADVTGTMSFDGLTGNLSGIIDDIGSIFFDDDNFIAPMPPNRTARIKNWTAQLYGASMFGFFRMTITANGGAAGQALVSASWSEAVRASPGP